MRKILMPRMRYPLVIFDLDGTLVDSYPWFLTIVNDVARRHGFKPIEAGEVDSLRRAGSREILRRLDVPLWKLPSIAAQMHALKREHAAALPLFPGVDATLRTLKDAGMTLALVTSDNEENARRQLGTSATHFSHFACGASLFGKPSKFRSVVRRAGVAPARTIAIGDEVRDIEAARAAGIGCAAVAWGYAASEALAAHAPDMMFQRMTDIERLIDPA
jgi:phosphoglycolate phosphatase